MLVTFITYPTESGYLKATSYTIETKPEPHFIISKWNSRTVLEKLPSRAAPNLKKISLQTNKKHSGFNKKRIFSACSIQPEHEPAAGVDNECAHKTGVNQYATAAL